MVYAIADNIISPLGGSTLENLQSVLEGKHALRTHTSVHGAQLVEPVVASLMDERLYKLEGYTLFESYCIRSAEPAISASAIDAASSRCVFVISSTKGDIWAPMAESAAHIAAYFGNHSLPVVVSTACTSGVSAQLAAFRLLECGAYDTAVVIGCDVQCEFIVSGFQSFKALSDAPCRPFDAERKGLNAGEAAATLVLTARRTSRRQLMGGSVHNDANHISGPSRTAEGSLRCLNDMLELVSREDLAFVSVHGTGTLYNDEMESIALQRAGLSEVPVSALKGFYGHTMGAAGLMETILSMHALEQGIVLPAMGFSAQGTTWPVNLSLQSRPTDKSSFIKLLSGFGGVNAAVAWKYGEEKSLESLEPLEPLENLEVLAEVKIGKETDLVALYRQEAGDYPKFFKMDTLSRLGFMAVRMLLKQTSEMPDTEHTALLLASRSASLKTDTDYQHTIADKTDYFPSPATFVYTLPNIVAGEVAIYHKLFGETMVYVTRNEDEFSQLLAASGIPAGADSAIIGWLECTAAGNYYAHLQFIRRKLQ